MGSSTKIFPMPGVWYPTHKPGIQIRGTLERQNSNKTILKLCCLSDHEYESFKEANTIQGINSSGRMVTLLNCFVVGMQRTSRSDSPGKYISKDTIFICNIKIFVNYTLIGAHVPDVDSESFQSIYYKSAAINDWCHTQYFEYEQNEKEVRPWAQIYQTSFCDNELTITVISTQSESTGLYNKHKKRTCTIKLEKKNKKTFSIRQLINIGFPLLRLLPFFCDQDHGCISLELGYGDDENVPIYFNDNFSARKDTPHVGDILSLKDLANHLQDILTAWYRNNDKYIRMSMLFRHTLSNHINHGGELITAYVRILEIMLDRKKYHIPNDDKQLVKEALSIIKNIPEVSIRDLYIQAISKAKNKTNTSCFVEYMESRLNTCPYFDQLLEALKLSIKIRNDETHLNEYEPTTHREYILRDLSVEILRALIKLRLLEKLGVPDEACRDLFENHMHFRMNRRNFVHLGKMLAELN